MKLKKTLALGLVAAMAASFTACGSTAARERPLIPPLPARPPLRLPPMPPMVTATPRP